MNFLDEIIDVVKIFRSEINVIYFEGATLSELSITDSFIQNIINYDLKVPLVYIDLDSITNHYRSFKI